MDRYNISSNTKYPPLPIVNIAPIIKDNNKIIFFSNISGEYLNESDRKVIGVYDLEKGSTDYYGAYPEIYNENWGVVYLDGCMLTIILKRGK